jgi:arginine utilization protein RocB
MSDSEPSLFIEIHDPHITAISLAAEVETRVRRRRQQFGKVQADFPAYGAITPCPQTPQDLPYRANLFHHLRQANRLYNQVQTDSILVSSPATSVPVFGRLWGLMREQAHSLVLFYVNRATAEQLNVNRHLVSVLNELTIVVQEQQQTISGLQQEIQVLHHRIEQQNEGGTQ